MIAVPIVYVRDMQRSLRFYQALGGKVKSESKHWSELDFAGSRLALHWDGERPEGQPRQLYLSFLVEGLEGLVARLDNHGLRLHREISDEAFGRSCMVCDPDGLLIQINEHDPELTW